MPIQAHNGNVEGTAAEVEDEDILRPFHLDRIMISGRNRLILQIHFFVSGAESGIQQPGLGQGVGLGVIGKTYGTAENDLPHFPPQQPLGPHLGQTQVRRYQVFEGVIKLAHDRPLVFGVPQPGFDGQKQPSRRKDIDPGIDVGDIVHIGPVDLDFADPDFLQLDGTADIVRKIAVNGLPPDVNRLVIGYVERCAGDFGVGIGWI